MPGVAVNGSEIYEVIKPRHVLYSIEHWVPRWGPDEDGNSGGGYWTDAGTDWTHAKITGSVVVPSSKMKLAGANVATQGDRTIETWVADPPVPTTIPESIKYTAISSTSGSGQGRIISGSTRGKLDGKPIALIGSTVETCLGTITTIKTGNEKMKFSS